MRRRSLRSLHLAPARAQGTAQAAGLPGKAFFAHDGDTKRVMPLLRMWHANKYADAGQCAVCMIA